MSATREWQPIETAPKDTWIIVYLPWCSEVRQGRFSTRDRRFVGWKVCFYDKQQTCVYSAPSHWMPLPDAPDEATP